MSARDDMLAFIMKIKDWPQEIAEIILGHLPGYVLFPGIHTVHRLTVDTGPGDSWHATVQGIRGNLPAKYNIRMLQ